MLPAGMNSRPSLFLFSNKWQYVGQCRNISCQMAKAVQGSCWAKLNKFFDSQSSIRYGERTLQTVPSAFSGKGNPVYGWDEMRDV